MSGYTLEPTSGSESVDGWAVVVDGDRRGTVALNRSSSGVRLLRWNLPDDLGLAIGVLTDVVARAFESGATRVEARVPVEDTTGIRAASIAGLRREGIARGHGDDPDRALLARLVDDPSPTTRDGFIALLNAGLPTKRVIAQGLLRDEHGRVLLCRLTYKREWDLPGGVVEVGESPAVGLVRELEEELGVTVEVRGLITVNWLPAWRGWDDACIFLFDLGTVDAVWSEKLTLQPTEILGVEWCDDAAIAEHATLAAQELLAAVAAGVPPYRENSPSS